MRNLAMLVVATVLILAAVSILPAQTGELQWFTPNPGGITLGDIQQGAYSIKAAAVGVVGRQGPEGLVVVAAPGAEYRIEVKAAYKAAEPTKVAGNIKPDTTELFQQRFAPNNDMTGYNATVHFSSEDRPGYQNVSGTGEITFTLQSWAPQQPGKYEKTLEVGLFTPKDSPRGQWVTIMIVRYPFTLEVMDPNVPVQGQGPAQVAGLRQRLPRDLVLYEGDLKEAPNQLLVSSWGGGFAQEVGTRAYYGPKSLQVVTNGFYQGVRLQFYQPPDITAFTSRPDGYLEFRIAPHYGKPEKPAATTATSGTATQPTAGTTPATGSTSSGSVLRRSGGLLGGRDREGTRVSRPTTRTTTPTTGTTTTTTAPEKLIPTFLMERMRIVVETEQGLSEYSGWPLYYATDDRPGWKRLGIPLALLKGAPLGARLKSVAIFGEPRDVFYLGQVKLCAIEQPVTISANAQPAIATTGTVITFTAKLTGYSAPVRVSWDFDSKNGVTEEAVGMSVSYIYRTPGIYTVTCTATDTMGRLEPATTTVAVQVQ